MAVPFTFGRGAADGSTLSTGETHDYLRCAVLPGQGGRGANHTYAVDKQVVTGVVVLITATGGRDCKSWRIVVLGESVGWLTRCFTLGNS